MGSPSIIDDKELLQMLLKGDREAFQQLYQQYYATLYLHAYQKLKDREAAKDIVHDLFANIWQKSESLRITDKISSYLYASIRNRVIDYIAKEQSKSHYLESLVGHIEIGQANTDYLLREKMLQEQIENVLKTLSPRVREVFELSRKSYLNHKEISQKLDLSEQSVRSYIKDALRVLRMRLSAFPWVLFILFCKYF
ncbi:RNA polymerase sigma factor [Sphingobacterium wenxiniae]|uniref:RNA polymerase sigma-70 factor, ECF subfamily n=1 Tax=Sphingobacterium wenxiniae TaxID=683125 RepID=A0A1I6NVJ1_9SPHI|nr:RNA polymerase sigma-70 factor [Sphingobacterium wenxiniae]SFS31914.1 RNA polymerase sigma-70 factor, ECF subfamily [Sphingobacterium wenxiniae]